MVLICSLIALSTFLLSWDRSWSNLTLPSRNALVFEGRNQEYGAFVLRNESGRKLALAFGTVLVLSAAGLGLLMQTSAIEVPVYSPGVLSDLESLPILSIDETPREKQVPKEPMQTQSAPAAGDNLTTPEVVDNTAVGSLVASDLILSPSGSGNEGEEGIRGPVEFIVGTASSGANEEHTSKWKLPAEVMPLFPGGDAALFAYLSASVKYPDFEREVGVEGTVWITFVISATGEITDVGVERGVPGGKGLERAAMIAISKMPNWIPGRNGDTPVPVRQRIPVRFVLKKK